MPANRYLPRAIEGEFASLLREFPVVTVLGPRQAGKTTMVRSHLADYTYVSLEDPEQRAWAAEDPKAFLKQNPPPVILDEIQRAPELLSYLQVLVDERPANGQYVLTGSHQLELRSAVSQSLAGRTAILHLLPLSISELESAGITFDCFEEYVFRGFLPRIHDQKQRPRQAYASYYQTYVERDVRQLIHLKDASLFEKFMKLLAGRTGQIVDYTSLGNDVGVDAKTLRNWLSILEASFIVFKLPPYHENFGKRVIKSPKYYFTDVGLLAYLLDIEKPEQVSRDPLVGGIFENLIILECLKARFNQGRPPNLYFFRDSNGNEVDLLHASGHALTGIEIKAAGTWNKSLVSSLHRFGSRVSPLARAFLVYNGATMKFSDGTQALHFRECPGIFAETPY
ncbi:ATP-binding protein [Opitutaceae bacterium TAV4]|nr:ATP-binding protein [Opitutaceae bacterium TAV4]RRJ98858.1 ATP-binding protein [Opitutaceae bacterium TAV3]